MVSSIISSIFSLLLSVIFLGVIMGSVKNGKRGRFNSFLDMFRDKLPEQYREGFTAAIDAFKSQLKQLNWDTSGPDESARGEVKPQDADRNDEGSDSENVIYLNGEPIDINGKPLRKKGKKKQ